jgi:predicted TIM-barrel fold metal-dependent hydrolase
LSTIDVDCHLEVAVTPEEHPLRQLRDVLPSARSFVANAGAGDLRVVTPHEDVPHEDAFYDFLPPANRSSAEYAALTPPAEPAFQPMDAAARAAWMDEVGIDFAFMNPGSIGIMAALLTERRAEAMRLSNDHAVEQIDGRLDRFSPVSLIDFADLDVAISEMTRMRGLGSRAFWIRAEPFGGMSPAHPDWDRVWAAANDLGMVAILHVGNTPAPFAGGWGNAGWNQPEGTGLGGFFRFANSLRHHAAEMMLAGMVYGGVFGRHPNLTVITEELGVGWLPYFVSRCEILSYAGPWPFDRTPGEMIRQGLRAAPLPGLGDPNPLTNELLALSDMLIFSSDFPHGEGNGDPVNIFEPTLELLGDARSAFLGDNIAACFQRMGDPLPVGPDPRERRT